jgi:hypothetical protein
MIKYITGEELAKLPLREYPPEPKGLTWKEMVKTEPQLAKLLKQIQSVDTTKVCWTEHWFSLPKGFKQRMKKLVGFTADGAPDRLRTSTAYDIAYKVLYRDAPACQCPGCTDTTWADEQTAYKKWFKGMDEIVDPAPIEFECPAVPKAQQPWPVVTLAQEVAWVASMPEGAYIAFTTKLEPVEGKPNHVRETFERLKGEGYWQFIIDGKLVDYPDLDEPNKHDISVVGDKFVIRSSPSIMVNKALIKTIQDEFERDSQRQDLEALIQDGRIRTEDYFLAKTFLERRIADAIKAAHEVGTGSLGLVCLNAKAKDSSTDKPLLWFYVPKDPKKIPQREWMHAKHYIRKHVVMTSAPGDFGKTSLVLCNSIEMATDRGLIGPPPFHGPYRVAYWNAEDPDDEIDRRIAAICLHYDIDQNILKDQLIIGGMLPTGSRLAWVHKGNVVFDAKLINRIEEYIGDFELDCLICDPLIAFHSLPENDVAMEKLIKQVFGQIAIKHNCCIELTQHMRKSATGQYGGELSGDDSRGSSSIKDAVRSMRVLNRMSKDEASVADIPEEERRAYLRIDRGKGNMLPPQKATWFHLANIALMNGDDACNIGDEVQVVEQWTFPQVIDAVNPETIEWLRKEVTKGEYRLNAQAKDWIGYLLIRRLKLEPDDEGVKKRIKAVIKALLKAKEITTEPRKDKKRMWRDFVIPGEKKAPEERE